MAWFINWQSKFWSAFFIKVHCWSVYYERRAQIQWNVSQPWRSRSGAQTKPGHCERRAITGRIVRVAFEWARAVLRSNLITSSSDSLTQPVCLCLSGICEIQLFKPPEWQPRDETLNPAAAISGSLRPINYRTKANVTADLDIWALYNSKPLTNLAKE